MIKVKDIAEKCNVSTATVSKALHNSKELRPETIAMVCKVAKEIGYIPNASARSLKLKKSYSIGVLFVDKTSSGLRHEYFSSILDSIKVEAESLGYDVTFISRNITNENMTYLEHARYRNVDGVVIASVDFHDPQVIELVNSEVPTVTIDYIYNNSSAVMSDNTEGLEKLVQYAYDKGHRKIAFIHGEITDVTNKRIAGFYKATQRLGIEVKSTWIIDGLYHDPKIAGQATKRILADYELPTCIIYPDDVGLIGGETAIQHAGLKIPDDISVIGYDGVNISRILRPIVTTYVQNSEMLGRLAVDNLIERIENPNTFTPKITYVSGRIQEGETVKDLNEVINA
jgi:LacI family transcriptional regulator